LAVPDDPDQSPEEGSSAEPGELSRLLPQVYDELRAIAGSYMRRERAGHTLQPTAVVHEAWTRLAEGRPLVLHDRRHFLALAARCMRQVLVDHARTRDAAKRGGHLQRVTLAEDSASEEQRVEVLDLNEALERLEQVSPRQARIVELRYFGGLTVSEIAAQLGLGLTTVQGDWAMARAWLLRELESS
jgi:RNA polymerase sigma factor (TIGR02999 family)